ncbi:hypothetical protein JCM16303_003200 [Sporobolomyces ruberrimus]
MDVNRRYLDKHVQDFHDAQRIKAWVPDNGQAICQWTPKRMSDHERACPRQNGQIRPGWKENPDQVEFPQYVRESEGSADSGPDPMQEIFNAVDAAHQAGSEIMSRALADLHPPETRGHPASPIANDPFVPEARHPESPVAGDSRSPAQGHEGSHEQFLHAVTHALSPSPSLSKRHSLLRLSPRQMRRYSDCI